MTSTIRFGKIETITVQNGVTLTTTENVHDYTSSEPKHRYTRYIFADTKRQALAESLKLMDMLDQDEVTEVGYIISKRNSGSKYKVDVSWMAK